MNKENIFKVCAKRKNLKMIEATLWEYGQLTSSTKQQDPPNYAIFEQTNEEIHLLCGWM